MQKRLIEDVSPILGAQPDRGVECLLALIPAFRGVVNTAEEAGWTEEEVASSLLALVHVYRDKLPAHVGNWH